MTQQEEAAILTKVYMSILQRTELAVRELLPDKLSEVMVSRKGNVCKQPQVYARGNKDGYIDHLSFRSEYKEWFEDHLNLAIRSLDIGQVEIGYRTKAGVFRQMALRYFCEYKKIKRRYKKQQHKILKKVHAKRRHK